VTRAELRAALTAILHRTNADDALDGFIARAGDMIASRVRALETVTSATLDDTDRTGNVYALPADYGERIAIYGTLDGVRRFALRLCSVGELREIPATALPLRGAIYGTSLEISGAPATGAEWELVYFARPALASGASATNALLTAQPNLYIHGALFWGYMREEAIQLATAHKDAFENEARLVNTAAARAMRAGATSFETVNPRARTY
jgi:hypothetical protein